MDLWEVGYDCRDWINLVWDRDEWWAYSALTVGDVVCFSMPLSSIDGVRGTWDTDNENILSLDPTLGIGRVRTAGNVIVKYHLPSSVSTFIELEALPVTSIKFLEPSNKTLVNTVVSPNFRVPIVLENSRDTDKIGNLISRNGTCPFTHYRTTAFPFMCEIRFDSPVADVDVQDVFAASQDFDINTGTYGCVILPSGTLTVNKSVLHTNFSLHVFTGSVFSQPFKIPFKPAMYVHSEQVNLSDARMAAYVTVSGRPDILKQVRVYPYDGKDFLTVSGPDVMETNKAYYQVRLTDKYWKEADLTTPMSIIVNSEVTFQNIERFPKCAAQSPKGLHLRQFEDVKSDELHAVQTKFLSHVKTNNEKALEASYFVSHDLALAENKVPVQVLRAVSSHFIDHLDMEQQVLMVKSLQ
ncbi:hypothetical protein ANN_10537 [Periplaneta americana]|uniref:Uncharacterized protein n=1 Tax=Periplaneta americana TaxID=6978 RepID=A0ABQ8TSG1_PERAM|nr:hypothetical protein ANN_10537 [Periplaneta americana]